MRTTSEVTPRHTIRPTMLLTILGVWTILNASFAAQYIQIVKASSGLSVRCAVAMVLSWIIVASFYAGFHVISFLFSLVARRRGVAVPRDYERTPHVVILYPCMNDMKESAIKACLSQDYSSYTLYVLDDSTLREEKERVNMLQSTYGERVTIIRRADRRGYKAGNLNHGLS